MQKNSGVSVAKHKHNKKQSGTLREPFIQKGMKKNSVHREPPVGSNEPKYSQKSMNNNRIRRVVQQKWLKGFIVSLKSLWNISRATQQLKINPVLGLLFEIFVVVAKLKPEMNWNLSWQGDHFQLRDWTLPSVSPVWLACPKTEYSRSLRLGRFPGFS